MKKFFQRLFIVTFLSVLTISETKNLNNDMFNDYVDTLIKPEYKIEGDIYTYSTLMKHDESTNNHKACRYQINKNGDTTFVQYWGWYQIGKSARKDIGLDNVARIDYLNNKNLQDLSLLAYILIIKTQLRNYIIDGTRVNLIREFNGKVINGCKITESGLIAMVHLVGIDPTEKFLMSSGKYSPRDSFKTEGAKYLKKYGGLKLKIDEEKLNVCLDYEMKYL